MRVNKEMLDALIQYRMEQISQHCVNHDLMEALVDLRRNTKSTNLKEVLNMDAFNNLFIQITEFKDFSEGHFTIEILKDASSLLAMGSCCSREQFRETSSK